MRFNRHTSPFSFYGLNRTVTTIKDAVMVLGFRGVRSLVLATSTAKFLQCDFACYGHDSKVSRGSAWRTPRRI